MNKRVRLTPVLLTGVALALAATAPAAGSTGPRLTWSPPPCGDATHACVILPLANTGSHQVLILDSAKDYILQLPNVPLVGGIDIDAGHNVILIGGEIDLTTPCTTDRAPCHGINISMGPTSTGTVYVEGVLIKNPDASHSQYTGDGIDVSTTALSKLTIQNVRIEGVDGCSANGNPAHADVFQPYGATGAVIQVDHLTGTTDFQGMQIPPDLTSPASADYRNININVLLNPHPECVQGTPDQYAWWVAGSPTSWCGTYPMTLTNDYTSEPNGSLAYNAVWPDPYAAWTGCPGSYSNGVATWPQLTAITGGIQNGPPPGGDFVPAGVAGLGYVSPGYQ
jgi:hypothetical protein